MPRRSPSFRKSATTSRAFSRWFLKTSRSPIEFDQSQYVRDALNAVLREGIIGALLTGLTLLLFLRDWRSSLIVVITIPFALLTAVVLLRLTGQTINIMTLGGLALASRRAGR